MEPLLGSWRRQQQQPAYSFVFNPSDKLVRGWKLLMFVVGIYVSWLSPYFFGFLFDLTTKTIWQIQDYLICAILFVDCLISFNTVYFDKNTNAIVKNRLLIAKHFLYGWGSLEIVSVIPISLIVLLFPAKFEVVIVRIWTCTRLVHIRKVFKTLKSWKKSSKPKLVICVAKWTEIIFMTLFTIHCMACILYLIAHTNPKFERTWLSLVEDERAKESNQDLYDYTVSIYWATTSFTTVGYGDIHPVSPRERIANLVMMVFGVGLISYLSSCVNELLAARSNEREELLEALEEYINRNSSLSVELQQEMFNHLSQHGRRGDLEMRPQHNILNYFPKNIQMKVKNKLFSARISKVYLFQGVSPSFCSHLVAEMEFQTFGSNQMVILKDEFPENFWILLNGTMVRDIPNNLKRTRLHICGELGVISQLPQPFSVRTTEKSTLLTMKRAKFLEVLKVNREVGEIIFTNMLKHLADDPGDAVLKSFHHHTEKQLNRGKIEISLSIHFAITRKNSRLLLHLIKQGLDLEEEYGHGQTILEESLEALEEYNNRNSSLPDEIQQEMFNHLNQLGLRGDLEMRPHHNILNYFPKNIQMEVKNKLFSARISQVYLFQGVSASFLSHLVAEMEFQNFGSNEMVILKDEFPENFWILLNGNMVRHIPNNLVPTPLHICGELGVISQLPQPFSVRATEKTTLLMIKQTNLFKLFKVYKEDGEEIFSNMLKHLEKDRVLKQFYDRIEKKLSQGEIEIKLSIQFAIRRKNPRLLLHLLKQGSDLEEENANGQTILHIAVMTDIEPRLISILLQYSLDVNKRDSTNQPPISYALNKRRREVLEVFRERDVRIPSDKAREYCKFAIQKTDLDLLELLDYLGVDMNLVLDDEGNTPIHFAVSLKNIQVVRYLLKLKADFYARNINGTSALELAATLHFKAIFGLMCSWSFKRRSIM